MNNASFIDDHHVAISKFHRSWEQDEDRVWEFIYYQGRITTVSTHVNNPEDNITCSDKLNENDVKTMKEESENVTNVKDNDEVYTPIVKDHMLKINRS